MDTSEPPGCGTWGHGGLGSAREGWNSMVAEVFPTLIPWNTSSCHLSCQGIAQLYSRFSDNFGCTRGCGELCSPIPRALSHWNSHFPFAIPCRARILPELPILQLEPRKTILIPWKSSLLHDQGGCSSISCSMEFQQSRIDRSCAQIPMEKPQVDTKGFRAVWIYWESSRGNDESVTNV